MILPPPRSSLFPTRRSSDLQIADAKQRDILLSLHLKATMMKVSDPIIFGHAVTVYFADLFEKHAQVFHDIGVDPDRKRTRLHSSHSQISYAVFCLKK